ncbi:MAG: hypothetical protein HY894_05960 [Deltaproteobacteria bacterium]|nr:hypothetical protein [Deltaproteobacteria bacterium]
MNIILKNAAAVLILCLLTSGCASAPDGPIHIAPALEGPEGYAAQSDTGVFESKLMRLAVTPLGSESFAGDVAGEADAIGDLAKKHYIVVRLEIENKSVRSKLIFNPAYVALLTSANDYYKPLDYTDIYEIVNREDERPSAVMGLRGRFYDLTVTLAPGKKTSRLMLFEPIKEGSSAELMINNVYIGREDISVRLPFVCIAEAAPPEEKKPDPPKP